jgi:hypothetical protein
MFYPGSRIQNFSSRILGVKKHRIPDPTVHKKRDEKFNQKTYPLDPGSGKNSSRIQD